MQPGESTAGRSRDRQRRAGLRRHRYRRRTIGQNVADRTRAAGLGVTVVERELVGGECSYWGCIPNKALLRPVITIADARRVDCAREAATGSINSTGLVSRRDRYVTNWDDHDQAERVRGIGADLVRGHARLQGPRRVAVATSDDQIAMLTARNPVAVCIGNDAELPDIPGIAEALLWTNRKATGSSEVPTSSPSSAVRVSLWR